MRFIEERSSEAATSPTSERGFMVAAEKAMFVIIPSALFLLFAVMIKPHREQTVSDLGAAFLPLALALALCFVFLILGHFSLLRELRALRKDLASHDAALRLQTTREAIDGALAIVGEKNDSDALQLRLLLEMAKADLSTSKSEQASDAP